MNDHDADAGASESVRAGPLRLEPEKLCASIGTASITEGGALHNKQCRSPGGGPRCADAHSQGQAVFEALAITLVLAAGFWGLRWMHGEGGALALLVQALRLWHERFATLLALPV